jgi:FG-GAP-like repeat
MKPSIWLLTILASIGAAFPQVPQIQSMNPPSAAPGIAVPVVIYGMGFTASSAVYVNGAKVSSQNAGRQLSLTVNTPSTPQTLRIQVANSTILSPPYSFPVASPLPPQPSGPGFASAFAAPGVSNLAPSVTADFNGDGIPDVAFMADSDSANGSIDVLLGQGNGQFTEKQAFGYSGNWGAIAAVSLNNSGKVDLIFDTNSDGGTAGQPGTAYVAYGNGDGTFQAPVSFAPLSAAPLPNSIGLGDFGGIGYMAVFLGTTSGYNVSEYYSDGLFTAPVQVFPGYKITGIAVGDLLNTGRPDLVLATDQGLGIAIDNNGNNIQPVTYQLPEALTCVVVGDFNNDGNLDIVAGDANGGFYPILGDGQGDLVIYPPVSLPSVPSSVITGDFNNDGKLDLIWGFAGGGTLTMLGNGDGSFTAVEDDPTNLASPQIHGDVYLYPPADYNNDGRLDLVDDSLTGGGGPFVSLQSAVGLLNVTSLNFGTIQFGL